jgi:ribosomal protein L40E
MSCSQPDIAERLLLYLESKVQGELCSRCGAEIGKGARTCAGCGNPVSAPVLSDSEADIIEKHVDNCPDCALDLAKLEETHMALWRGSADVFSQLLDCPPSDELVDFAAGGISNKKQGRTIKKHLASCPKCSNEYELLQDLERDLAEGREEAYDKEKIKGTAGFDKVLSHFTEFFWGARHSRLATVAASLVILCGLSWLFLNQYSVEQPEKPQIAFVVDNRVITFRGDGQDNGMGLDEADLRPVAAEIRESISSSDIYNLIRDPDLGKLLDPLDLYSKDDSELGKMAEDEADYVARVIINNDETNYVISLKLLSTDDGSIISTVSDKCSSKENIPQTVSELIVRTLLQR